MGSCALSKISFQCPPLVHQEASLVLDDGASRCEQQVQQNLGNFYSSELINTNVLHLFLTA